MALAAGPLAAGVLQLVARSCSNHKRQRPPVAVYVLSVPSFFSLSVVLTKMSGAARTILRRGYATASSSVKPPVQLNSLTGTYATSTYLAALKKSPKDLEALAKDIEALDKKIKTDDKVSAFIGESRSTEETALGNGSSQQDGRYIVGLEEG